MPVNSTFTGKNLLSQVTDLISTSDYKYLLILESAVASQCSVPSRSKPHFSFLTFDHFGAQSVRMSEIKNVA